jgi:hypothetical protein
VIYHPNIVLTSHPARTRSIDTQAEREEKRLDLSSIGDTLADLDFTDLSFLTEILSRVKERIAARSIDAFDEQSEATDTEESDEKPDEDTEFLPVKRFNFDDLKKTLGELDLSDTSFLEELFSRVKERVA